MVKIKGVTADFNNHQGDDFMTQNHRHKSPGKFLGAMPFEKRPRKEFHSPPKPFRIPEGYNPANLEKGFDITTKNTKV